MIRQELNKFRYEFMQLERLWKILKECPAAIVPTGSLEWHGEHNSLGLDGHSAMYTAEYAIESLGNGVLFPTNWLGTYGWPRYPGCLVFNQSTVQQIFYEYFRELIKIGFRVCVILTGHWGPFQTNSLVSAAKQAQSEAEKKGIKVQCLGLRLVDLVPDSRYGHAQVLETSIEMAVERALGIELVDRTKIRSSDQDMKSELYEEYNPDSPNVEPPIFQWSPELKDNDQCNADIGENYIKQVGEALALEILEYFKEMNINY